MDRGIILGFRRKMESDFVFTSQIQPFGGKPVFQVYWLDAKFHHGELGKKVLIVSRRGFDLFEKGIYFRDSYMYAYVIGF